MQVWNSHEGLPLSNENNRHLLMWLNLCMCFGVQMGSYFGYAVATTDINSDGWVVVFFFAPVPAFFYPIHSVLPANVSGLTWFFFWLQDDWSVGGSSHVHGSRIWQPSGRNGPGLCLPTAQPPEPGVPSISSDRKPGVWEIWEHHCTTGRFEPGRLQW